MEHDLAMAWQVAVILAGKDTYYGIPTVFPVTPGNAIVFQAGTVTRTRTITNIGIVQRII
jgi:hypothetical protein